MHSPNGNNKKLALALVVYIYKSIHQNGIIVIYISGYYFYNTNFFFLFLFSFFFGVLFLTRIGLMYTSSFFSIFSFLSYCLFLSFYILLEHCKARLYYSGESSKQASKQHKNKELLSDIKKKFMQLNSSSVQRIIF